MKKTDLKVELSEQFALDIVDCYNYLCRECKEYIMSNQLLRSGTSIGANIAESLYAESYNDFIHKLSIAQKEASETGYWLKLLHLKGYLPEANYQHLQRQCKSLIHLLSRIIVTARQRGAGGASRK